MKRYFLLVALGPVGMAGIAHAQTSPDFAIYDAEIGALQQRIDAATTGTRLKPEALEALQGKQQELVNQEAKLKAAGTVTSDEKSAMALSIKLQQQRLTTLTHAAMPQVKPVDPASLPAPTYVTPNGTTISGSAGSNPAQSGVIPLAGPTVPTVPVVPAPTQIPAQQ